MREKGMKQDIHKLAKGKEYPLPGFEEYMARISDSGIVLISPRGRELRGSVAPAGGYRYFRIGYKAQHRFSEGRIIFSLIHRVSLRDLGKLGTRRYRFEKDGQVYSRSNHPRKSIPLEEFSETLLITQDLQDGDRRSFLEAVERLRGSVLSYLGRRYSLLRDLLDAAYETAVNNIERTLSTGAF